MVGDLVFWKVILNTKETNTSFVGLIWEGTYKVVKTIKPRTYNLEEANEMCLDTHETLGILC